MDLEYFVGYNILLFRGVRILFPEVDGLACLPCGIAHLLPEFPCSEDAMHMAFRFDAVHLPPEFPCSESAILMAFRF